MTVARALGFISCSHTSSGLDSRIAVAGLNLEACPISALGADKEILRKHLGPHMKFVLQLLEQVEIAVGLPYRF